MKTLYQLEQEAKEARDNAIFLHGSESPLSQDIVDSFINAAVAMVTYQFALGMQEVSGDGSGEALPEVSQEERDSDGWIDWNGGNQPTDDDTAVEVILRGGEESSDKAFTFYWRNDGVSSDIIAYRIVK